MFWAKGDNGQYTLLDDYNQADSSPYQQESWYTLLTLNQAYVFGLRLILMQSRMCLW
ncbi:MAG: hypothetical protein ACPG5O_09210 [Pseudoalteromonas tetraodonis]